MRALDELRCIHQCRWIGFLHDLLEQHRWIARFSATWCVDKRCLVIYIYLSKASPNHLLTAEAFYATLTPYTYGISLMQKLHPSRSITPQSTNLSKIPHLLTSPFHKRQKLPKRTAGPRTRCAVRQRYYAVIDVDSDVRVIFCLLLM